jgi:hypothetical protein
VTIPGVGIPSGAVVFFDLVTCPTGWTAFTKANGRTVVGLNPGGTLQGGYPTTFTSGGLADQSPRTISEVPAHAHGIPAQSTGSAGAHIHSVITNVSINSGGAHDHDIPLNSGVAGANTVLSFFNGPFNAPTVSTSSAGAHTHTVNNPAVDSDSAGAHAHTIAAFDSDSAGVSSVDVTMPYVQLLTCRKD